MPWAKTSVCSLSGGEQWRLRLARLILLTPDILVLDEHTNHLDIASREAIETALLAFPGEARLLVPLCTDLAAVTVMAQGLAPGDELRGGGHCPDQPQGNGGLQH